MEKFKKEVDALTGGNPMKPDGENETALAEYWFNQGKFRRDNTLMLKCLTLKRLLLLSHPSVSDVVMNDVALKQWQAFISEFPDEGEE